METRFDLARGFLLSGVCNPLVIPPSLGQDNSGPRDNTDGSGGMKKLERPEGIDFFTLVSKRAP